MIQLQRHIVYGPVLSRRLGRSLGINLLPTDAKVCSFNCLYCQYGWTDTHIPNGNRFPEVIEVIETVEAALRDLPEPPAYITFSGNGEATLHPQFSELVERINDIRDRIAPSAKTAILSNSSTVFDSDIRASLSELDVRIMKLDAGTDGILQNYNQPAPNLLLDDIQRGLETLEDVTIQTLFTAGPAGNATPENIEAWIDRLIRIEPLHVQIYSLDRGHPSDKILPCTMDQLNNIKKYLQEKDINANVYT